MLKRVPLKLSLLIGSIFIGLDQLVKFLLVYNSWGYSMNKGLPFVGDHFLISIGLYILLFITLVFLIFKTGLASKESLNIPIILVLSGVISNLVDRLLRGGVIDFIDVKIWPVFNLADIFITLGLVWLCFVFLFRKA